MARRELGPGSLAVVQAVEAAWSGWAREEGAGRAVLVACSGGTDSLALAFAAVRVARRHRLNLSAVVVDHRLQDSSAEVAAATVSRLKALGYEDALAVAVQVDRQSGRGTEAAARDARYRVLEREAERRGAAVLLGHTIDDQAETVLLGLTRGSGARSLAGMAARSGRYLRPLLQLPRSVTAQVCAELGLPPWHDPANEDPAYARARVRRRVLPVLEAELGPGVAGALARTAALSRDDADLLDHLALQAHPDSDAVDCSVAASLPAALRRRVLRRWLVRAGSDEPTYAHVRAVEALVLDWHGQRGIAVPAGIVVRIDGQLRWRGSA